MFYQVFWFITVLLCANGGKVKRTPGWIHSTNKNNDSVNIGGSNDTTIEKYPYQVYLRLYRRGVYYQCGGSIISARYILTAAHCLWRVSSVEVRAGSSNKYTPKTSVRVDNSSFHVHPQHNRDTLDYDVAIIDLKNNLTLNGINIGAIKLPNETMRVDNGTILIVTGWGQEKGHTISPTLGAVEVQVTSRQDCQRFRNRTITPRMLCAGVMAGRKGPCKGSSGGPAVVSDGRIQVGITSFGRDCWKKARPGIYTDVAALRDWIKEKTNV